MKSSLTASWAKTLFCSSLMLVAGTGLGAYLCSNEYKKLNEEQEPADIGVECRFSAGTVEKINAEHPEFMDFIYTQAIGSNEALAPAFAKELLDVLHIISLANTQEEAWRLLAYAPANSSVLPSPEEAKEYLQEILDDQAIGLRVDYISSGGSILGRTL